MIHKGFRSMCLIMLMALVPMSVTGTVDGNATAKHEGDATAKYTEKSHNFAGTETQLFRNLRVVIEPIAGAYT